MIITLAGGFDEHVLAARQRSTSVQEVDEGRNFAGSRLVMVFRGGWLGPLGWRRFRCR